jgi:ankyrin repeat protein
MATLESLAKWIPSLQPYFGGFSQQKLLFVPYVNNEPDVDHEISEPAIFRFLLNEENLKQLDEAETTQMLDVLKDIDKQSKITQVEVYRNSVGIIGELQGIFHVFIVFKTTRETDGDYWWSLEKPLDYTTLQRSRIKENVKNKFDGDPRNKVKPIVENLKGKGTIKDLFEILWAHQMIPEKYHILKSNCQSFVTFISQQITEIEYEYEGYFPYSPPPESGRNKKMLDLINILRGQSDWPPLFTLIEMGSTDLVDKIVASGKYDINACYNGLTPLHFAIWLKKTKMVKHLLQHPMNADPTKRNETGRNALHVAADMFEMNAEIIDLLLAHSKVKADDVDELGRTALHLAASVSNVIAVQKLLERGANPNIIDKNEMSPLHLAAQERDGNPIIDLLLEAKKVKGMGDVNDQNKQGRTALHYAALTSNKITAEHLILKGADLHCRNNGGITPLHVAAFWATDMKIIDFFLQIIKEGDMDQYNYDKILFHSVKENMHGLEVEIGDRFYNKKGIKPWSTETDECSQKIDELTIEKLFDINGRDRNGQTPLFFAIRANNVNWVGRLLKKGADPTICDNKGLSPFHLAVAKASSDSDDGILNSFLANAKDININQSTPQHRWTALHVAVVTSNVTAARFLLSKGANPNVANKNGVTPLHLAAVLGKNMDIIELLLNHEDVDVNCLTNDGQSALHYAMDNKKGYGERIANRLKEKSTIERENKWFKGNRKLSNEIVKKHMHFYRNRNPLKIENFLSDDTIPIETKIAKISEEYLVSAIKDSNVESFRLLMESGGDISALGEKGENALHWASFSAKTTDIIDAILETGKFDINGVDSDGNTPLHYAMGGTNCEKNVPHLIRKGADPNIANNEGNKSFQLAPLFLTDTDVLGVTLGKEKKIEIDERNQKTALHLAISKSNVTAVRSLLSNGANPNVTDENGSTPLHLAVMFAKDMDIVELLLNHKDTNVDYLDNEGHSVLYYAMCNMHGHGERIAKLLKEKDVVSQTVNCLNDEKVENDETSENIVEMLADAIVKSEVEFARLLTQLGVDISTLKWGKEGWNALHMASKRAKKTEILDVILDTGKFDINGRDVNGATPLHHALRAKNMTTARYLLEKGADPTITDNKEITSLQLVAYFAKDMDFDKLLLNHEDVDVNCLDNEERNALDYARENKKGHAERIVNLIKGKRAAKAEGSSHEPKNNITALVPGHIKEDSDMKTVRFFKENSQDISALTRGENGANALHLAAADAKTTNLMDAIQKTQKTGEFDIDGVDNDGLTPLHHALNDTFSTKNVLHMIPLGADPYIGDKNGVTSHHSMTARNAESMDLIELLLNTKAVDVNCADKQGRTPLSHSRDNKHQLGERVIARGR